MRLLGKPTNCTTVDLVDSRWADQISPFDPNFDGLLFIPKAKSEPAPGGNRLGLDRVSSFHTRSLNFMLECKNKIETASNGPAKHSLRLKASCGMASTFW